MFKVSDTFRWPVEFEYAEENEHTVQKFTAVFRRMPAPEYAAKLGSIDALDPMAQVTTAIEVLEEIFTDFEEVEFEGDRDAMRRILIEDPTISAALMNAYSEAVNGTGGIRAKNSK